VITRENGQVGVGLETKGGGRGQEQQGEAFMESEELGRGFGTRGDKGEKGGGRGLTILDRMKLMPLLPLSVMRLMAPV